MEKEIFMQRCIQLAQNGLCNTAPNPMVGAVIVCNGLVIGEGYHVRCGEAHAEVNAIRSVKEVTLLKQSTIYVSLEPCSHYGKTPPCTDLIINAGIPRVVIGCQDPFAEVAGRGIQKLKEAGCEVVVGVLEKKCSQLIRRFVTFHQQRRPYITLKWAQSADGYMDLCRTSGSPVLLSTPLTSMLVHKKRAEYSAIMVGTHTALLDNPSLSVRHWHGPSPIRIVLDRHLTLPTHLHLFDGSAPTLVFTSKSRESKPNVEYLQIDYSQNILPQVLNTLHARDIQSLLVEGGSILLTSFIEQEAWDEAFVEESPILLNNGVKAPHISKQGFRNLYFRFGHYLRHYVASKEGQ